MGKHTVKILRIKSRQNSKNLASLASNGWLPSFVHLSVIKRRFQLLDIELLHLEHFGRHCVFLRHVLGSIPLIEICRRDLPAHAKPIDLAYLQTCLKAGAFVPIS